MTLNIVICNSCDRPYIYSRAKGHGSTQCNSCYQKQRRLRFQQIILEVMGDSCWACGYNKARTSLHQHHIDPSAKKFKISGSETRKESVFREELAKCVQLCGNCHCEVHEGITQCPTKKLDKEL